MKLAPRQLFEHQTVAELVQGCEVVREVEAEQGTVVGEVELTAIQRWFFDGGAEETHHFNQAVLLDVRDGVKAELVKETLAVLERHHDALRMRYARNGAGWKQTNGDVRGTVALEQIDLTSEPDAKAAVAREATRLQASLSLEEGPVWRAGWMELGAGRGRRLLLVIHHLVVDGVSWRILLDDLQRVYGQLARGEAATLPRKTTSFQAWAKRLKSYADSEELKQELGYWRGVGEAAAVPTDLPDGENRFSSEERAEVELTEEETRALLQEVPSAYRTQVNDVLLTGLVEAYGQWSGERRVVVALEGHGREELWKELDVTRTVGWFTSQFPVELDARGKSGPGEALKAVKEQLRSVPNRGFGYGVLRYLGAAEALGAHRAPQMSFNYLGQFDQVLDEKSPFGVAKESTGRSHGATRRRGYLIDINANVSAGRLKLVFSYSRDVHRAQTIERFAAGYLEALRDVIRHCLSLAIGSSTPSDFPLAQIDAKSLEELEQEFGGFGIDSIEADGDV